jgi:hypothetical protein
MGRVLVDCILCITWITEKENPKTWEEEAGGRQR